MAETQPRQGSATGKRWSLVRDNQFRTELEEGARAFAGPGVLYGGHVTKSAAQQVTLESGTIVYTQGVEYTLGSAQTFAVLDTNSTVHLWGLLTRTAANQNNPGDSDTFSFVLSKTTGATPSPPSADHIHLAVIVTGASEISTVDDMPPGKYIRRAFEPLVGQMEVVAAWVSAILPGGHQASIFGGTFTVRGTIRIGGKLRVIP